MSESLKFWIIEREKYDEYLPKNESAAKLAELMGFKNMTISDKRMDKIWEFADSLGVCVDFETPKPIDLPRLIERVEYDEEFIEAFVG